MNFLAHLTLSQEDDDLLIGNFIADSVRRVQLPNFKDEVVRGIALHHKIDEFTDQHPVVERSKERLRPRHGKYSGVIVDIFYDHYLARFYPVYGERDLSAFARYCYEVFTRRYEELSLGAQRMLPYMKEQNWLVNYAYRQGMERVFKGMSRRARFANNMDAAVEDLWKYYEDFQRDFALFYPELEQFVNEKVANGFEDGS